MPTHSASHALPRCFAALLGTVCLAASVATAAQPFSIELGVAYDRSETSASTAILNPDVQVLGADQISVFRSDTETDSTNFFARWFYDGASAATGPRSRAGFVSRASSVSLSFSDSEGTVWVETPPPLFSPVPIESSREVAARNDGTVVSLDVRHVFERSGWYLLGSASIADTDVVQPGLSGGTFETNAETSRFIAGAGKYLGKTSSLDLAVLHVESELQLFDQSFDDSLTEYVLSFTHIAGLNADWQYGLDLAVSTVERFGEEGQVSARFSLFPSRSLALGIDIDAPIESAFDDNTRYGVFLSWFATRNFELFARADTIELDAPPNSNADGDGYGLGVRARF
ncbi:MAG: hypothetical protein AAFX56_08980 [Pseudomonadota bacterium]